MEDTQCCVCYVVCAEFTPCAHPLCSDCSAKLEEPLCPLCRQSLDGRTSESTSVTTDAPATEADLSERATHRRSQRVVSRSRSSGRPAELRRAPVPPRRITLEPLPVGPLATRPYMRRSWMDAGLPGSDVNSAGISRRDAPSQSRITLARPHSSGHATTRNVVQESVAVPNETTEQQSVQIVSDSRHRSCWSAFSLGDLPSSSVVFRMNAESVILEAERLAQLIRFNDQHRLLARMLAERAHHLIRPAKDPTEIVGVLQLQGALRNLQKCGLLVDRDASKHLPHFDTRIKELENDSYLARLRSTRVGISGQPLAQNISNLDHISAKTESGAKELQDLWKMLYKLGLMEEQHCKDYQRFIDNRVSELKPSGKCDHRPHLHKGSSCQELQHRANSLRLVLRSLIGSVSQLRSTLQFLHLSGFIADDEMEEHICRLDGPTSNLQALEADVSSQCSLPQRSRSLPRLAS